MPKDKISKSLFSAKKTKPEGGTGEVKTRGRPCVRTSSTSVSWCSGPSLSIAQPVLLPLLSWIFLEP